MKYAIMIKILFELLTKTCVSAAYLSKKYRITVRTVYRYINCMEEGGVPLYAKRGSSGGFCIMDTFKLNSAFLNESEFKQVIGTLTAINEQVPNSVLDGAINKIKATDKSAFGEFDLTNSNLIIDGSAWGENAGYKNKLAVIEKSIEELYQLEISYHDRKGETSVRVIEPHAIILKQGLWYVFAYCTLRNEFRLFKTGRIEQAKMLEKKFIKQDISKIKLPLDFWNNGVNSVEVELEIDKSVLSDVEEWLGVENVWLEKNSGKYRCSAKLPFDKGLVGKIMSFGKGVKVLSPLSLKKEILKSIEKIYENYL